MFPTTIGFKILAICVMLFSIYTGYKAWEHHIYQQGVTAGRADVQKKWDDDTKARKDAEDIAVHARIEQNRALAAQQAADAAAIERKHDEELAKVRNDLATERLQHGKRLCSQGFTSIPEATSTSVGNAADPGAGLFQQDIERDFKSLILTMEETAATGRSCQKFVRDNGFAPPAPTKPLPIVAPEPAVEQ